MTEDMDVCRQECPACDGFGEIVVETGTRHGEPWEKVETCDECNGTGWVYGPAETIEDADDQEPGYAENVPRAPLQDEMGGGPDAGGEEVLEDGKTPEGG